MFAVLHGYRVVCLPLTVALIDGDTNSGVSPDLVSMMDPVAADDLRTRWQIRVPRYYPVWTA